MSVPSPILEKPDRSRRVSVVVDRLPAVPERRIASREEMIEAGARVLARRGRGRHRKPDTRESWPQLLAGVISAWAPTLRVCLLLVVGGTVLAGVALVASPQIGVAVGTFVAIASLVGAVAIRPRRTSSHRY
ncbi:hypothetical protein ATK36_0442 [Amycolatopsis sulphurea]|uniref:DUF3040 family protein n=1 Tax=Amycolatopsis sulphurea TaxID=76022 RepID=A0A2A9G1T1_9PSEU|nr:hypothetical protein [Amycolatopsis sulphurea]PFG56906.1 hypothetical protein ATK36_0442 [Amycolatopsis sulphurea]